MRWARGEDGRAEVVSLRGVVGGEALMGDRSRPRLAWIFTVHSASETRSYHNHNQHRVKRTSDIRPRHMSSHNALAFAFFSRVYPPCDGRAGDGSYVYGG